jgi:hypothetical protein
MVAGRWVWQKRASCNLHLPKLPLVRTSKWHRSRPRPSRSQPTLQLLQSQASLAISLRLQLQPTSHPLRPRTSQRPRRLPRLPPTDLQRPRLNPRIPRRPQTGRPRSRTGQPMLRRLRRTSHPLLQTSRAMSHPLQRTSLRPRLAGLRIRRRRELPTTGRPMHHRRQTDKRRRKRKSLRKRESRHRKRTNPSLSRTVLRHDK